MSKTLGILFEAHEAEPVAAFAQALGFPFDLLSLRGDIAADLGAGKVFAAGLEEIPPADGSAASIKGLVDGYSHLVAVSSMQSKDILSRLAGLLDCAMVSDALQLVSPTVFKRPVVAGSIIETIEVLSNPVAVTFRPASFGKPQRSGRSEIDKIAFEPASKAKRVSVTARGGARPDLTQAKVVVSGGRPLRDAATFEGVIGGLADALGGAVGATRAAVDSGIAPNELQVGQTGKIVAPDLYIAAGISGSTQHMAGIKDSKTIVAINKDPDAPIFAAADLGLVADLYEAIPEIRKRLGK